jgi:hypothetical protein
MPTADLSRLDAAFHRRIEIAVRWHGLKTPEDISNFLLHDPDVAKIVEDPEWHHAAMIDLILIILSTDNVEACRDKYGHEFVDAIFASAEQYIAAHNGND